VDRVIRYVEMNPARAGISGQAGSYQWSSAEAHLTGTDRHELLNMAWWGGRWQAEEWRVSLGGEHQEEVSAYHISEKQPRRRAAPGYYK
jgi:hypothetical protein